MNASFLKTTKNTIQLANKKYISELLKKQSEKSKQVILKIKNQNLHFRENY
jgi:hypothetical protein